MPLNLAVQSLEQLMLHSYRVDISMYVEVGELFQEIVIEHVNSRRQGRSIIVYLRKHCGPISESNCACHPTVGNSPFAKVSHRVPSVSEAFARAAQFVRQAGKPLLHTVFAPENVLPLARKAFAAALALPDNSNEFSCGAGEVEALRAAMLKEALLRQLGQGPEGINRWNASPSTEITTAGIDLKKYSLNDMELNTLDLSRLDVSEANFDNSSISKGIFTGTNLTKATFRKSILDEANFSSATMNNADFTGASMKKIFSYEGSFRKCKFKNADLSNSRLENCDLCGADFTDANMEDVILQHCKVDEKTIFPPSFKTDFAERLVWKGAGSNPYIDVAALSADVQCDNADEFIDYLWANLDEAKMDKAMKMLRQDRFQLFCEVSDSAISGVVRSQIDPDLLYSCSLSGSGTFSCCTQNLKACGGLAGSLCKHILVLLLGLAKAGSLDYSRTALWCVASKAQRQKMDNEAMTALFLKYKGAEGGEIDWRPTETIPEDYYA